MLTKICARGRLNNRRIQHFWPFTGVRIEPTGNRPCIDYCVQSTRAFASEKEKINAKEKIIELVKQQGTVNVSGLHGKYEKTFGDKLEHKKLGFKNIWDLLEDIESVSFTKHGSDSNQYPLIVLRDDTGTMLDQNTSEEINLDIELIDTDAKLQEVAQKWPFGLSDNISSTQSTTVAVNCEGEPDNLLLVQVYSGQTAYVFDCVKLGPEAVCRNLRRLFFDGMIEKIFYDVHNDVVALGKAHDIHFRGVFDTQLAMEKLTAQTHLGFAEMLKILELPEHPLKREIKQRLTNEGSKAVFASRPLDPTALKYAALDVSLLFDAHCKVEEKLQEMEPSAIDAVRKASTERVSMSIETGGHRQICFDAAHHFRMASRELLTCVRPDDVHLPSKAEVKHDIEALLHLIPDDCKITVQSNAESIIDIVLDSNRPPHVWSKGERIFLRENYITTDDIQHVEHSVGYFGSDNRSILEGQLHRISCIRNRDNAITGLTMRVGRHVQNVATILSDILSSPNNESVLILGGPGTGKTTLLRDVTRILAETLNVCIVDKSNEIGGDSDSPHRSVGHARRMMVPQIEKQADVMIECVQNHTPQCIIVDEIGHKREVFAAETCKNRGVRMVATAHGNLESLVQNKVLNGLVGGVETVPISDAMAWEESKKIGKKFNKLRAQRAGNPIFDVVVELQSRVHGECRIVMDPGRAVDDILEGRKYSSHKRTFNHDLGRLSFVFED